MIRSITVTVILAVVILSGCNKKEVVNPAGDAVGEMGNSIMGLIYTGKVVDGSDSSPLADAHVVRKGSMGGTATELDGTFSIWLESFLPQVLVISFTGYQTKEIPVDGVVTNLGTIKLYEAP